MYFKGRASENGAEKKSERNRGGQMNNTRQSVTNNTETGKEQMQSDYSTLPKEQSNNKVKKI